MWVMDEMEAGLEAVKAARKHLAERIKDKAVCEERHAWLVKQGRCREGDSQGRAAELSDRVTRSETRLCDAISQARQQLQSALQGTAAEEEADSGMFVFAATKTSVPRRQYRRARRGSRARERAAPRGGPIWLTEICGHIVASSEAVWGEWKLELRDSLVKVVWCRVMMFLSFAYERCTSLH